VGRGSLWRPSTPSSVWCPAVSGTHIFSPWLPGIGACALCLPSLAPATPARHAGRKRGFVPFGSMAPSHPTPSCGHSKGAVERARVVAIPETSPRFTGFQMGVPHALLDAIWRMFSIGHSTHWPICSMILPPSNDALCVSPIPTVRFFSPLPLQGGGNSCSQPSLAAQPPSRLPPLTRGGQGV
jgi:hypothetical protein